MTDLFTSSTYRNLLTEQASNTLAYREAQRVGKRKKMIIIAERQKAIIGEMLRLEIGRAA